MGALGVALTRPPGVPERRAGEDPWKPDEAHEPPAADLRRPRVAAPGDRRAGARTGCADCATAPPWRRGRSTATPRRGSTACASGACSTPRASCCTTRGRRPRAPAGARASASHEHAPVAAGGVLLEAQQRGARAVLELLGERVERVGRGRLDVRAVAGAGLLEPPGVEVVAQVGRRPERLAVLVGDPVAGRAARPAASCTCPGGATAGGSARRSRARRRRRCSSAASCSGSRRS